MGRLLYSLSYNTTPTVREEPEHLPQQPELEKWTPWNPFDPDSDEFNQNAVYEAFVDVSSESAIAVEDVSRATSVSPVPSFPTIGAEREANSQSRRHRMPSLGMSGEESSSLTARMRDSARTAREYDTLVVQAGSELSPMAVGSDDPQHLFNQYFSNAAAPSPVLSDVSSPSTEDAPMWSLPNASIAPWFHPPAATNATTTHAGTTQQQQHTGAIRSSNASRNLPAASRRAHGAGYYAERERARASAQHQHMMPRRRRALSNVETGSNTPSIIHLPPLMRRSHASTIATPIELPPLQPASRSPSPHHVRLPPFDSFPTPAPSTPPRTFVEFTPSPPPTITPRLLSWASAARAQDPESPSTAREWEMITERAQVIDRELELERAEMELQERRLEHAREMAETALEVRRANAIGAWRNAEARRSESQALMM